MKGDLLLAEHLVELTGRSEQCRKLRCACACVLVSPLYYEPSVNTHTYIYTYPHIYIYTYLSLAEHLVELTGRSEQCGKLLSECIARHLVRSGHFPHIHIYIHIYTYMKGSLLLAEHLVEVAGRSEQCRKLLCQCIARHLVRSGHLPQRRRAHCE